MADKIKNHDFVELDYTGKLADGLVFDTTKEDVAKENNLESEGRKYAPNTVCVGEAQLLPGLDAQLEGREIGESFTVTLSPENAFGKRDIKKMRIVPMSTFKEHNVQPQPGLQVDMDGERGIISRVSGGRVIVNFNHPLAGKEVTYDVKIHRKINDNQVKVTSFLSMMLGMPKDKMTVEVKEDKAKVILPVDFPIQISTMLTQKLVEVTGLKDVLFEKKEVEKKSEPTTQ